MGLIKSLEEIYLFSLPIKESEIIDFFLGASLKDEVLKIMPVQKQTRAGQRTRFKAIGDYNGHVGLGVKCSKEVATAIRAGAPHPCPQWHWHRLRPCAQEAAADGRHRRLLHFSQGLHRHPGQLRQGHF